MIKRNLAHSYESAGRLAEAIAILEQVSLELERVHGPERFTTLTARCSLAISYRLAGRVSEAVATLERTAADSERVSPAFEDVHIAGRCRH